MTVAVAQRGDSVLVRLDGDGTGHAVVVGPDGSYGPTMFEPSIVAWGYWREELDPELAARAEALCRTLTAAAWAEEKHPRHPKGSEQGGEFAPKPFYYGVMMAREGGTETGKQIGWQAFRMERGYGKGSIEGRTIVGVVRETQEEAAEDARAAFEDEERARAEGVPTDELLYAQWLAARRKVLAAAGWDETKHPRHPAGTDLGGEFAPKGTPASRGELTVEEEQTAHEARMREELYPFSPKLTGDELAARTAETEDFLAELQTDRVANDPPWPVEAPPPVSANVEVDYDPARAEFDEWAADMEQWYTEKEGFTPDYWPTERDELWRRYETAVQVELDPLRERLAQTGIMGVSIQPQLSSANGGDMDAILDPERELTPDFNIEMRADPDAHRTLRPGVTLWTRPGDDIVEDIIPLDDRDFFPGGPESETAVAYTRMIDAVAARPTVLDDTPVTMYRGMSDREIDAWEAGDEIPAGKFFTSRPTAAYAQDIAGEPPVLQAYRIPRSALIEVAPGEFQLRKRARQEGGHIRPVTGAGVWDEQQHPRHSAGSPQGGEFKRTATGDKLADRLIREVGPEGVRSLWDEDPRDSVAVALDLNNAPSQATIERAKDAIRQDSREWALRQHPEGRLTVYRGGESRGDTYERLQSWTTHRETALFFAGKDPARVREREIGVGEIEAVYEALRGRGGPWTGFSEGEVLLRNPNLTAAAWEETKHPRHPRGSERGGEFRAKLGDRLVAEFNRSAIAERTLEEERDLIELMAALPEQELVDALSKVDEAVKGTEQFRMLQLMAEQQLRARMEAQGTFVRHSDEVILPDEAVIDTTDETLNEMADDIQHEHDYSPEYADTDDMEQELAHAASVQAEMHEALNTIGNVHAVPASADRVELQMRGLGPGTWGEHYAETYMPGSVELKPRMTSRYIAINPNKDIAHIRGTMAHEFGHYMDVQIGDGSQWFSDSEEAVAWRDAVNRSEAVKVLRAHREHDPIYIDYTLDNQELFARSYAQWVALRAGDGELMGSVKGPGEEAGLPERQWDDVDFGPIAAELDKVFERWRE